MKTNTMTEELETKVTKLKKAFKGVF